MTRMALRIPTEYRMGSRGLKPPRYAKALSERLGRSFRLKPEATRYVDYLCLSTHFSNVVMNFWRSSRVLSLVSAPWSSNSDAALPM